MVLLLALLTAPPLNPSLALAPKSLPPPYSMLSPSEIQLEPRLHCRGTISFLLSGPNFSPLCPNVFQYYLPTSECYLQDYHHLIFKMSELKVVFSILYPPVFPVYEENLFFQYPAWLSCNYTSLLAL